MAVKIDYLISTNEDWLDAIELNDGAPTPAPLDLTGWSFHSQIRVSAEDATVMLDASTANGLHLIISSACAWNIAKAILAARLPAGVYVYDTVGTDPDGRAVRVAEGVITAETGVTRP